MVPAVAAARVVNAGRGGGEGEGGRNRDPFSRFPFLQRMQDSFYFFCFSFSQKGSCVRFYSLIPTPVRAVDGGAGAQPIQLFTFLRAWPSSRARPPRCFRLCRSLQQRQQREVVNAVADEDDPRRSRDLRSEGGRTMEFVQVVSFVTRSLFCLSRHYNLLYY